MPQNIITLTREFTTVYIGFYDQPPSQGSRSLNLIVVAKLSGFSLGLTTRWSLNPMYSILRWVQRPPKVSTVAISLHKGQNQRSLNTRSLCSTKKGPSRRFWSLKPDWPLYPQSQNPMLTVLDSESESVSGAACRSNVQLQGWSFSFLRFCW